MGGNSFAFSLHSSQHLGCPPARLPPSLPLSFRSCSVVVCHLLDPGTRQGNDFLELAIELAFACPLVPFDKATCIFCFPVLLFEAFSQLYESPIQSALR